MKFEFTDRLELPKSRRTNDGYLVGVARVARVGLQKYRGSDIGLDKDFVNVYRPEEEVFKDASMATFAHKPITDDHPKEMVTDKNWKDYSVGQTGGDIARDGQFIVVPLSVMDGAMIQAIEDGKVELSAGYTCDIDYTSGKTPDGETYDAIQRNIRINHVAVVDKGRAGPKCRIGDKSSKDGVNPMKTIVVDGLTIETTDQGAEVIAKLQKDLSDARNALDTAKIEHTTAIADKDKELGEKDNEIEKLKKAQKTDAELDQLAQARASVIADAKSIDKTTVTDGLSTADIRRSVVAKKLGDDAVKDKSDDYVEARFEGLVDAVPDAVRTAVMANDGKSTVSTNDTDSAYNEMINDMENAWKGDSK